MPDHTPNSWFNQCIIHICKGLWTDNMYMSSDTFLLLFTLLLNTTKILPLLSKRVCKLRVNVSLHMNYSNLEYQKQRRPDYTIYTEHTIPSTSQHQMLKESSMRVNIVSRKTQLWISPTILDSCKNLYIRNESQRGHKEQIFLTW